MFYDYLIMPKRAVLFNENALDDLKNDEVQYWLGFLTAYAVVYHNRICLNFKPRLLPTVSRFIKFVRLNRAPKLRTRGLAPIYSISFNGRSMANALNRTGALSGPLSPVLARSSPFWTGYFEGKAGFTVKSGYPALRVAFKRREVTEAFSAFFAIPATPRSKLVAEVNGSSVKRAVRLLDRRLMSKPLRRSVTTALTWTPKKPCLVRLENQDQGAVARHNAFTEPSPKSLYWAGFLMADGCVRQNTVSLGLARKDRAHIKKFKQFVGSKNAVRNDLREAFGKKFWCTRFAFSSSAICKDLRQFGVTANKSTRESASKIARESRDFWRGVVDGDGTVNLYQTKRGLWYPLLRLSGSRTLVSQWNAFARNHGLKTAKLSSSKASPQLWSVSYSGTSAFNAIKLLYNPAVESLDRKLSAAKRCLAWNAGSPGITG